MFIKAQLTFFSICVFSIAIFLYLSLSKGALRERAHVPRGPKTSCIKQKRLDVTKDFYICDGGNRHHHHLFTPASILSYDPSNKKDPLVESMENISGTFEDKKHAQGDFQQVHSLWAPKGSYHYMQRYFTCDKAFVSLFSIPKQSSSKRLDLFDPFLEGQASNVCFSFETVGATLTSESFNAKVNTEKRGKP